MSWLARSIANTLSLNDDEDESVSDPHHKPSDTEGKPESISDDQKNDESSSSSSPRGVREDLSELTKTLTRQFWGVASFLAPPPLAEPYKPLNPSDDDTSGQNLDPNDSEFVNIAGIRSDFAEIGGKFKTGITKLSNNINVSEITKVASSFLQLGQEEEDDSALAKGTVGVSEQALAFARDIAMHPETWLDFPLPGNEGEEDFDMSDAQQEHALAVEHLVPRLSALRIELCPGYISKSRFWKIYFVLLHPTLDKEDAELLSTTQVLKVRAMLTEELQNRVKAKIDKSKAVAVEWAGSSSSQNEVSLSVPFATHSEDKSLKISVPESTTLSAAANSSEDVFEKISIPQSVTSTVLVDSETDKHPIASTEIQIVDKSVIEEHINQTRDPNMDSGPSKTPENKEDDGDDWLKEEPLEVGGEGGTPVAIDNEEDVSFSDLEEDDDDAPTSLKTVNYTSDKDSREWVQL